jgi:hypothetical protein
MRFGERKRQRESMRENALMPLLSPADRCNREGYIVLALYVRPSAHPNFVSTLVLCNYWLEFSERICSYRRLIPVRPFNTELWPLIMHT